MADQDKKTPALKLPERLVTSVELARVFRELRILDDWLNQANLRSGGKEVKAPKTSATLEELATMNGVSLLDPKHRESLVQVMTVFVDTAPRIKMSFAVEPSASFLKRMIVWLRANISPVILLEVGLQPTLAAGCTVRTNNKFFDMSLRNRFTDNRSLLVQSIAQVEAKAKPATPQTAAPEPQKVPVAAAAPAAPEPQTPAAVQEKQP